MTNPVIYAAAYVLLTGGPQAPLPQPADDIGQLCQLPPSPIPPGHVNVQWKGNSDPRMMRPRPVMRPHPVWRPPHHWRRWRWHHHRR